jgi:hypothetical protein
MYRSVWRVLSVDHCQVTVKLCDLKFDSWDWPNHFFIDQRFHVEAHTYVVVLHHVQSYTGVKSHEYCTDVRLHCSPSYFYT